MVSATSVGIGMEIGEPTAADLPPDRGNKLGAGDAVPNPLGIVVPTRSAWMFGSSDQISVGVNVTACRHRHAYLQFLPIIVQALHLLATCSPARGEDDIAPEVIGLPQRST